MGDIIRQTDTENEFIVFNKDRLREVKIINVDRLNARKAVLEARLSELDITIDRDFLAWAKENYSGYIRGEVDGINNELNDIKHLIEEVMV